MNTSSYQERARCIAHEFQSVPEDQRYFLLVKRGRDFMASQGANEKKECEIANCQSNTWFDACFQDNALFIRAGSDSSVICGVLSIFTDLLAGLDPSSILAADLDVFTEIGLQDHLAASRSNILHHVREKTKQLARSHIQKE